MAAAGGFGQFTGDLQRRSSGITTSRVGGDHHYNDLTDPTPGQLAEQRIADMVAESSTSSSENDTTYSGEGRHQAGEHYNNQVRKQAGGENYNDEVRKQAGELGRSKSRASRAGSEVPDLARELSRMSSRRTFAPENLPDDVDADFILNPEPDSELDPNGPNFKAVSWAKAIMALTKNDPNHLPRTAGFAMRNVNVHGFSKATDYQATVSNIFWSTIVGGIRSVFHKGGEQKIDILQDFDAVLHPGEMLVVLGPPGSGCTTFLKTIAGELNGIYIDDGAEINYQGISPEKMRKTFFAEAIYTAEVDVHFPQLTVGDTLEFAAAARCPSKPPGGLTRLQWSKHMAAVIMAVFGISHTRNTKVGNEFVRGVSGGERKRVTIAEASLSQAPLQCWDNSTRGLDSANAISFCRSLRLSSRVAGTASVVAIYQAPQSAYDVFDKVCVIYEGRQIFYGPRTEAVKFWVDRGFHKPTEQTEPDFLTALTSPAERQVRKGFEGRVPRTPEEFSAIWRESENYRRLQEEISAYQQKYTLDGEYLEKFQESRRVQQSKHARPNSPYMLDWGSQVGLCLRRGFQRLRADPSLTVTQLIGNGIMALIVASVFYNLPHTTSSFYSRGALLFFAILLNAFGSALEILTLYAQRPIVEKHWRYGLHRPSAEATASMLTDMPYKIVNAIFFNLILYFMTNLRRTPGAFFFFLLFSFLTTLVMSMFFRSIASLSRSLTQALAPAAVVILALVLYTGFALPVPYMLGWIKWVRFLNPVFYSFESLMINEFSGQEYECSQFVPPYPDATGVNRVCSTVSAQPGSNVVYGTNYIESAYSYYPSHRWRNLGILFAFLVGLGTIYVGATEVITEQKSKGEVKLYPQGKIPKHLKKSKSDEEAGTMDVKRTKTGTAHQDVGNIQRQDHIFSWQDVCYDVKIKKETRRILDHVDGWVKPGTLTALMGASGAGKTTLLDVLANRVSTGVITGEMLIDGQPRLPNFQRQTGYVRQADSHLPTATVRESLQFAALLRQPAKVSKEEKLAYVEEVLRLLEMESYADAIVGVFGEGLNVEERKRLTIAVELVAKPELLLFVDEPTSGLDSQTSWIIIDLLKRLSDHGQAVLCTIHQPSAQLFDRFDRLLFLSKGKTVYFGEVGQHAKTLRNYFMERGGEADCPEGENPAEWMFRVIGAAPGSSTEVDWPKVWQESSERKAIREELEQMKRELPNKARAAGPEVDQEDVSKEYSAGFVTQFTQVFKRISQQYWRTPSYILSKFLLVSSISLFIGFSFFNANNSQQGLQNQLFSIFLLFTVFGQLLQQILPNFVLQRDLYEVRERPSKTFSWQVFLLSNIVIELLYNFVAGTVIFFCLYYPVGLYRNAEPTGEVHERGALFWLLTVAFLLLTSTWAHMLIAGMETAETAANIGNLMFSLALIFCGVLASKSELGWWIWMYYLSPFHYLAEGFLTTGIANTEVVCAANEYVTFQPPNGQSCQTYMAPYISQAGGYLQNPGATSDCSFCAIQSTNTFLAAFNMSFKNAWRDFGILFIYIVFNATMAFLFYYLARVPKKRKEAAVVTQPAPESQQQEKNEKEIAGDSSSSGTNSAATASAIANGSSSSNGNGNGSSDTDSHHGTLIGEKGSGPHVRPATDLDL